MTDMLPCHVYRGTLIPGCWAKVVNYLADCTCIKPKEKDRIANLERRVKILEEKMAQS